MPVYDKTGSFRVIGDLASTITIKQSGTLVATYADFINFSGSAVQSVTVNGSGVDVVIASGSGGGSSTPQFSESATVPRIRTSASLVVGSGSLFAESYGTDVFFFVSGAIDKMGVSGGKTSVFGGDVHISGNLMALKISGTHQTLMDGTTYLRAGPNITIVTESNGSISISGSASGGGSQFSESLTTPRLRTTASLVIGSGSSFAETLGTDIFFFVSGTIDRIGVVGGKTSVFGGDVRVSGSFLALKISGTHQTLTDGTSYLRAGPNITIVTESNGSISISGSLVAGPTGSQGPAGGQWFESTTVPRLRTTASVAIDGTLFAEDKGTNVHFYVSGTIVTGSTIANSMSLIVGSMMLSGNLYIQTNVQSQSFIQLKAEDGDPGVSDVRSARLNAELFASRALLEIKGPYDKFGLPLQPALFGGNIIYAGPNTTTTLLTWGTNFTVSGTISTPTILSVPISGILGTTRTFKCTPIANVGLGAGARTTDVVCWRGAYSGAGGFFMHQRFGSFFQTPSRCFLGLNSTNAFIGHVLDISGSTNVDFIGIGYDRNDPLTGSWRLMRCGIVNSQYLSIEIPNMTRESTTGSLIDFFVYAAPFSTGVFVEVIEYKSSSTTTDGVIGTIRLEQFFTTSIPNPATFLRMQGGIFTQTGTLPSNLQISRMYLESNF